MSITNINPSTDKITNNTAYKIRLETEILFGIGIIFLKKIFK